MFPGLWYGCRSHAARYHREGQSKALAAVGANLGESNETGEKPVTETVGMADADRKITVDNDGVITIPAAAYSKPTPARERLKP
jgi:hypothetical protein